MHDADPGDLKYNPMGKLGGEERRGAERGEKSGQIRRKKGGEVNGTG